MILSDDAIPTLVQGYQSPSLSDATRLQVGAALACIRDQRGDPEPDRPWQGFHFSQYQADQALALVDKQLDAYKIQKKEWPYVAVGPGGGEYPCNIGTMD